MGETGEEQAADIGVEAMSDWQFVFRLLIEFRISSVKVQTKSIEIKIIGV